MSLYKRLDFSPDIKIAIWHIEESEEQLLSLIPPFFRSVYLPALERFKSLKRRREWLTSRVLLHTVFKVCNALKYDAGGKPCLAESKISISHTGDYVVVALSNLTDVGVDIELHGDKALRAYQRFSAPSEWPSVPMESQYALFLWTAKEAAYKLFNTAPDFRTQIRIQPVSLGENGTATATFVEEGTTCQIYYADHSSFFLSVAFNVSV